MRRNNFFKTIAISFFLIITQFPCLAQEEGGVDWGLGTSLIYNFQTKSYGTELRGAFPLSNRFTFVPEISYFFSFNPIHELYAGATLHYDFFYFESFNPYLTVGAFYNAWFNADVYAAGEKKKNNFSTEAGIGIIRNNGCIRPFIEDRYDIKWKEGNLRVGFLWFFNACGGVKKEKCPAVYL